MSSGYAYILKFVNAIMYAIIFDIVSTIDNQQANVIFRDFRLGEVCRYWIMPQLFKVNTTNMNRFLLLIITVLISLKLCCCFLWVVGY